MRAGCCDEFRLRSPLHLERPREPFLRFLAVLGIHVQLEGHVMVLGRRDSFPQVVVGTSQV